MDADPANGTTIYRFYAADTLVYLGVTGYLPGRLGRHAKRNWWRSCDHLTLTHYGTREQAEIAEKQAIQAERPLYNVHHNYDAPAAGPWEDEETNMNIMGSREFQTNYQRLVEPVVVKAKSRTLGTWYPAGTEVTLDDYALAELEAEIKRLKAELAKRPATVLSKPRTAVRAGVDRTLNNAPFTAVPK